jgi:hypothetical protein
MASTYGKGDKGVDMTRRDYVPDGFARGKNEIRFVSTASTKRRTYTFVTEPYFLK